MTRDKLRMALDCALFVGRSLLTLACFGAVGFLLANYLHMNAFDNILLIISVMFIGNEVFFAILRLEELNDNVRELVLFQIKTITYLLNAMSEGDERAEQKGSFSVRGEEKDEETQIV